jgi:hypothetical protein
MGIDTISTDLEREWAHNVPFGDWKYIRQRILESVRRRLELSQRLFPRAAPVLERTQALDDTAADRVLGNPFMRAVVFAATRHLKDSWRLITREQVEQFFDELNVLLDEGWRGGELPSISLLKEEEGDEGSSSHAIWQWIGDPEDRTITGITPTIILKKNPDCFFLHLTENEKSNLLRGMALLRDLLPVLTPSTLRHIDIVTLLSSNPRHHEGDTPAPSEKLISSSGDTTPGVIFISPSVLNNPWHIAEIVLHEGLHSKLYDVMATHNLLRPNYSHEEAVQIQPKWHKSSVSWNGQRSFFAMHVYAHLALFFQRVGRKFETLEQRFGPLHVADAQQAFRQSIDRAQFLGTKLSEDGAPDFGPAGRLLLTRLLEMVRILDSANDEGSPTAATPELEGVAL